MNDYDALDVSHYICNLHMKVLPVVFLISSKSANLSKYEKDKKTLDIKMKQMDKKKNILTTFLSTHSMTCERKRIVLLLTKHAAGKAFQFHLNEL